MFYSISNISETSLKILTFFAQGRNTSQIGHWPPYTHTFTHTHADQGPIVKQSVYLLTCFWEMKGNWINLEVTFFICNIF